MNWDAFTSLLINMIKKSIGDTYIRGKRERNEIYLVTIGEKTGESEKLWIGIESLIESSNTILRLWYSSQRVDISGNLPSAHSSKFSYDKG